MPVSRGKTCRKPRAGRNTMPGMRLRHLASRAGASRGGGGYSPPGGQAGTVEGRWQWQLAGHAISRMWRMPVACPSMSPSGSKCLAGGRSRQAVLTRPLTPAEGSDPATGGQIGQD